MVRDQQCQVRPEKRVVPAGDFNNPPVAQSSMFGAIRSERFMDSHGGAPASPRSGGRIRYRLDLRKNLAFLESNVCMVNGVSDHFPVVASVAHAQVAADQQR
jgi:endonuclease/exonuclease/phosphatase family metal-dependent hydrolase